MEKRQAISPRLPPRFLFTRHLPCRYRYLSQGRPASQMCALRPPPPLVAVFWPAADGGHPSSDSFLNLAAGARPRGAAISETRRRPPRQHTLDAVAEGASAFNAPGPGGRPKTPTGEYELAKSEGKSTASKRAIARRLAAPGRAAAAAGIYFARRTRGRQGDAGRGQ